MTRTSAIRLAYAEQSLKSAKNSDLEILQYEVKNLKKDLFERIRVAVEAATREPWLIVWDDKDIDDSGIDTEGIAYANIYIAISQFRNVPKLPSVTKAVQRAINKIPGGYAGTVDPEDIVLDDEDANFIAVYATAKITKRV